ncbi:MAG: hypothetical protein II343_01645 [Clostridia bacterium]|nr:hypothetical protein [Clostridia bacterium]
MNKSFFVMVFLGFLYAVLTGRTQEAAQSVISAGGEALETVLGLCGAFMLFGGISRVIEKSGVSGKAVTILKRPLRKLFGNDVSDEALGAVTMNMTANLLGMGNAATPLGLQAAKLLNPKGENKAPKALCLLLVLNSTAIELFPATVIAMRYAAGSGMATAVVLPTFVSTTVSCFVGVLLCKLCERRSR